MPRPTTLAPTDFDTVYRQLAAILSLYAKGSLTAKTDARISYSLTGPANEASKGREIWFGAVRKGKAYVSYHLMPVYACPDLLDDLSPELKKHMQGKSCFNFKRADPALFKELAALTKRGYQRFRKAKLIG
ncbi:MAG: hypothetical protein HZB53_15150 [Chloroflexi bacterium]|nr:hypothetical protein [Chloroflexota bacterium]